MERKKNFIVVHDMEYADWKLHIFEQIESKGFLISMELKS